jgi:hypothetical protein
MRIYLSTPATQLHAEAMAGCHVLESFALFATCPWIVRYRPTFAGMMLDSGAFTQLAGKPKIKLELGAYIDFATEHRAGYETIVNLDQISGDVAERIRQSQANLQRMRDAKLDPLPVFHQGEPWSVLEELAACGKVGLGFQRPIRCPEDFLDGCFSRLGTSTQVHGFAMAGAKFVGRYPFVSVDSATWIHELKALSAITGQASDVLQYLTQSELLRLVLLKYERLPAASAWNGREQCDLFDWRNDDEETTA